MPKVHEQDHDETDSTDNPGPDLENHFHEDSYPMQDSDIEDLLVTLGQYSAIIASTYHIPKLSAMFLCISSRQGSNGGLSELMFMSWKELVETYLSQA